MGAAKPFSHLLYVSKDGFESLQRQWWYILAIVSHLLCFLRVPETWYFVCNLAVNLSETYNSVTHKWLTDAVNIFFELPYALNDKGYGALQKQWMSILLVHHPIFNTYKGSPTLYFCLIWYLGNIGGNGKVWPISGKQMLSNALPILICIMHPMNSMTHPR